MRSYQALTLQEKVDLGVSAIKAYSTFPKAQGLLLHCQVVYCYTKDSHLGLLSLSIYCNLEIDESLLTEQ